jgi:hypothetical protein
MSLTDNDYEVYGEIINRIVKAKNQGMKRGSKEWMKFYKEVETKLQFPLLHFALEILGVVSGMTLKPPMIPYEVFVAPELTNLAKLVSISFHKHKGYWTKEITKNELGINSDEELDECLDLLKRYGVIVLDEEQPSRRLQR